MFHASIASSQNVNSQQSIFVSSKKNIFTASVTPMDTSDRERLARLNDTSKEATSLRAKASRIAIGLGLQGIADEMGRGMTRQKIANGESGKNFPNRDLMIYLHRNHGIDFNFIMNGDFRHLPLETQRKLFDALAELHEKMGQK